MNELSREITVNAYQIGCKHVIYCLFCVLSDWRCHVDVWQNDQ